MNQTYNPVETFEGMEIIEETLLNNVSGAGPVLVINVKCINRCISAE